MKQVPDDDPVSVSVAAYSADPGADEEHYAEHLLDRPRRFASSLPPSSQILDLGCGPGRDLRLLSAAGHRPVGLEMTPSFVDMARRHGHVIEGDIRDVAKSFPPSSFDGLWAQASLVHLSATEVEAVLHDLWQLLTPGGRLYACVRACGESGWLDEHDGRRWYTVWSDESFPNAVVGAGFALDDVTYGPYVEVWATK